MEVVLSEWCSAGGEERGGEGAGAHKDIEIQSNPLR